MDSIRLAVKLRKDLLMDVWPDHNIEENEEAFEDREDSTVSTTT